MFRSDICPDEDKLKDIVTPYSLKNGAIKIDTKVVVPQNCAFVLGHNGKALDSFREGEYFLCAATLPECCKKLKIHKPDKKGNLKKKFKVDAYFMNFKEYTFLFNTGRCVEMGNRAMGIFTAGAEGKVKLTIKDPRQFMTSLLAEFAYLRSGEAQKIVESWVEDCVIHCFRKNNFALSELISINPLVLEKCKTDVSLILSKQGLLVLEFEFTNFLLPKKHQKEYNENKKKQQQESILSDDTKKEVAQTENTEQIAVEEKQNDDSYVPFGNIIFDTKQEIPEEKVENVSDANKTHQPQNSDQQFVDLDIDKILSTDQNKRRCLSCGAENDDKDEYCTLCGKKL